MWLDNLHSCCSHSSATSREDFSFRVSIHFKSISIRSLALLDSGARMFFMDKMFIHKHKFPVVWVSKPVAMEVINGRMLSSGAVTEAIVPLILQLGDHHEVLTFYVFTSLRDPIILGLSWPKAQNPIVDRRNHSITFSQTSSKLQARSHVATTIWPKSVSSAHPSIKAGTNAKVDSHVPITTKKIVHSASSRNPIRTTTDSLPSKYEDFKDVFEKNNSDHLPEHQCYDCPIDPQEDTCPPFGPIYGLLEPKL